MFSRECRSGDTVLLTCMIIQSCRAGRLLTTFRNAIPVTLTYSVLPAAVNVELRSSSNCGRTTVVVLKEDKTTSNLDVWGAILQALMAIPLNFLSCHDSHVCLLQKSCFVHFHHRSAVACLTMPKLLELLLMRKYGTEALSLPCYTLSFGDAMICNYRRTI